MPNIVVETGEWGSSRPQDIHAVAQSVCDVFQRDASIAVSDTIILRFSELYGPRVLLERGANNEHVILVSAKDRLWAKLAFQFAHEYCHVFTEHYRVPIVNRFRWLEESICELASLWALLRMGEIWLRNPPYPNWASYGDALTEYANDRINAVQRFDTSGDFRVWLDSNIERMTADSIIRDLNNVVAVHLLQYFLQNPDAWQAITQMNKNPVLHQDLDTYFNLWTNSKCDNQHVAGIANLFGVPLQTVT